MARGGQQVIPRPESWQPGAPNPWTEVRDQQWRYSAEWVAEVLARAADPAHPGPLPPTPLRPLIDGSRRESGVLAPLFLRDDELRVVLTRRDGGLRSHRGEVAFPGGRCNDGEAVVDAALRETYEEIALASNRVRLLGTLEPLTTVVSSARITPFVGFVDGTLPALQPNPGEVDRIFDVSLHELTHLDCYHEEIWPFLDGTFPVWFFDVEDDTIWGATGRMLRRLLDLMLLTNP